MIDISRYVEAEMRRQVDALEADLRQAFAMHDPDRLGHLLIVEDVGRGTPQAVASSWPGRAPRTLF